MPDKSTEVGFARAYAGFCKFADCEEDIVTGVVGKVEERTHSGAEGEAFVTLFDDLLVVISYWSVVFTECVVWWEWCFTFREFGIRIVSL